MRKITVKGVGSVSVKPDYIVLHLTLTEKQLKYENALSGADARVKLLQGAVEKAGFVKTELKTLGFETDTEYTAGENFERKFGGYSCTYRLKLAFDFDKKRLSEIISAISACGANAEQSVDFTVKEPSKVSAELLKNASENALEKAKVLCEASGVKLGELVEIDYDWQDVNFRSQFCSAYGASMSRGLMSDFEPDDIKTEDSARFVWEII